MAISPSSIRIKPYRTGYLKTHRIKINSPGQVARIFSHIRYCDREKLICVSLDSLRHIVGYEVVSVGNLSFSFVHPREVLKLPLLLKARYIIIIHNHPSGDPSPSDDDFAVAKRLALAAGIFNIKLLYSVIVGARNYVAILPSSYDKSIKRCGYIKRGILALNAAANPSSSCAPPRKKSAKKEASSRIRKYEVLLKDISESAGRMASSRVGQILSSRDVLKYIDEILYKLPPKNTHPPDTVIYTDDILRPIKHCFYDIKTDSALTELLMEGVFLNASGFIVVLLDGENSVGRYADFYKKILLRRLFSKSRILGIKFSDVVYSKKKRYGKDLSRRNVFQ